MRAARPLATTVAALATLGLVTACGSTTGGGDGAVELTLWARGASLPDGVQTLLDEEFPDYEITVQDIPDVEDKLRAALRSRSGLPDVVVMGGSLPSFFEVSDQFVDLSDEAAAGDAVDWALELGRDPEGRQVALPTDIGPWGFFYRADALEELGYPAEPEEVAAEVDTWDAYRELAQQAADEDVYVCDHAGQNYQAMLAQNGYAYFALEDGQESNVVDSPVSHDAFVGSAALAQDGLCANTEPYTPEFNAALTQEKIVGFVGPAWEDGLLKSAGEQQAGDWRVTAVPGGAAATGGSFVSALAESDHADAAAEVAAFLGGPTSQKAGYLDKGLFPPSTQVHADPDVALPQDYYGGQDTLGALAATAVDAPVVYQGTESSVVAAQFFVALSDLAASGDDPETVYRSLVDANSGR